MVYVLDKNGNPLMPTERHGKVRRMLKSGQAKVVRSRPFTIKLLYDTTSHTQEITLGVDTGSGTFGTAAVTEDGKVLYMSEVAVRNDIKDKMTQRRKYRRNRRNRKTRYRKARFLNRKNSIKSDRFSPTMISKLNSHVKEIESVKKLIPVSRFVFETAQFDTHLMKNPALANPKYRHWGYNKGPNYGFENTKAMVLNRDKYKCQCCKGKSKDTRLEVHHIVFRSQGGSDEAENLITLCSKCHKKLHAGLIQPNFKGKTKGELSYATQMNSIRIQLFRRYPDAVETFGYVTKANRMELGVDKEHFYDACTIASAGKPFEVHTLLYRKKCIPDGDFQQTKGKGSEQPVTTRKIMGLRKFDRVIYMGKEYFVKGRESTGYAILMGMDGVKADFSAMPRGLKTPKIALMRRTGARKTWMVTSVAVTRNTA